MNSNSKFTIKIQHELKGTTRMHWALLSAVVFLTGCLQNGSKVGSAASQVAASTASSLPTAAPSALPGAGAGSQTGRYRIINATVANQGGDLSAPLVATLFLDSSLPSPLTDVCNPGTAAPKPCKCRFSWNEINQVTGGGIARIAETNLVSVTSYQATCQTPSVYTSEIADGTTIRLTLVADTTRGNTSQFSCNNWTYSKSSSMVSSDFRDSEGRAIKNILHYVCHDKVRKPLSISHRMRLGTPRAAGGTPSVLLANRFDVGSSDDSAQSYYYDFYVRSDAVGSINFSNPGFECPQVTVEQNGVSTARAYPLDSQFALALQATGRYTIPVIANTTLDLGSSGVSPARTLGYAAKPESDGTCPAVVDSLGFTRRMFRLRKYTITYPVRFQADGSLLGGAQPSNTIYIMDRPVDKAGQNPLKPLTRLGPKPCPFSLKTSSLGYTCTSALPTGVNAINIDGTMIAAQAGCPIYPPPATNNLPDGNLHIRPMEAWTPLFLEDTSFKACAFPSSQPTDPDIVTVTDTAQNPDHYYCARYYPDHAWITPPAFGSSFNKMPSSCEATHPNWNAAQVDPPAGTQSAINGQATYACAFTYNPAQNITNYDPYAQGSRLSTPRSGCCARCSGNGCGAWSSRNAASDGTSKLIADHPRLSKPNPSSASDWQKGCFDPSEDP